jgi:hypothetical protein
VNERKRERMLARPAFLCTEQSSNRVIATWEETAVVTSYSTGIRIQIRMFTIAWTSHISYFISQQKP